MNYIIDPKWFYWVSVIDAFKVILVGMIIVISAMFLWSGMNYEEFDNERDKTRTIVFGILLIVLILVWLFIPSKQTLIQMKVAEFTTYENVSLGIDTFKELIDYIVEKLR